MILAILTFVILALSVSSALALEGGVGPCNDSIDNEPDGFTDCADDECLAQVGGPLGQLCEAVETSCSDLFDNDADGFMDCDDPDCWMENTTACPADFGDAPDSSNHFAMPMTAYPPGIIAAYPSVFDFTLGAPYGPCHSGSYLWTWLGDNVTIEADADLMPDQDMMINIDPSVDSPDQDGFDDGLLYPTLNLMNCTPTNFSFNVTITNLIDDLYANYSFNAWFDWNRDGDWADNSTCYLPDDAPEWAVQNQLVYVGGQASPVTLTFNTTVFLPFDPESGPMWMRMTLSPTPSMNYDGSGPGLCFEDGETEDYYLNMGAPPAGFFILNKTLLNGGNITVGDTVTFMLNITNNQSGPFMGFSLRDNFDPAVLNFSSASNESFMIDNRTIGMLAWNLTGLGENQSFIVFINFTALDNMTSNNTAEFYNDFGAMSEDSVTVPFSINPFVHYLDITSISLDPALDILFFGSYHINSTINSSHDITANYSVEGINPDSFCWQYYVDGSCASYPVQGPMDNLSDILYRSDFLRPDFLYPQISFGSDDVFWYNAPSPIDLHRRNYHIMHFVNNFTMVENTSFWVELDVDQKPGSTQGFVVYLVGQGHDSTYFQSDWRADADAELVGSIALGAVPHHVHTSNSSHHLIRLSTNPDGTIGTKNINVSGDFWVVATQSQNAVSSRAWELQYRPSSLCNNTNSWYRGDSSGWSVVSQSGCPDVHVHFARNNIAFSDGLNVTVCADDGISSVCESEDMFFSDLPALPPTPTSFFSPMNGTYDGMINISWAPCIDPNGDAVTYNLSLLNADHSFNMSINDSMAGEWHVWNTSVVDDGIYDFLILCCDDGGLCSNFTHSQDYSNFSIDNIPDISCGDQVTSSWFLSIDLACFGDGLVINASNIVLDCNGHSITGSGSGYGINNSAGFDNITIKNCTITNFTEGISFKSSSDSNILDNIVSSNANQGIILRDGSNNNLIENNIADNNGQSGIYLGSASSCNNNDITNNQLNGNNMGISLDAGSSGNTIFNNSASLNNYGVYLSGNSNILHQNWLYNNTLYDLDVISGSGNNATLNFWGGYLCNANLGISKGSLLPYYTDFAMTTLDYDYPVCVCGETIITSVVLQDDLLGCNDTALSINGSDLVVDCAGHSLTGDGSYSGNGISVLPGSDNVTIRNCTISTFDYGINNDDPMADSGDYLTVESCIIQDLSNDGIFSRQSANWIRLINNEIFDGTNGINLYDSYSGDMIQGNTIYNMSNNGIFVSYAINGFIEHNIVHDCGSNGIYVDSVTYSTIMNNTLYNNVNGLNIGNSVTDMLIFHNNIYDNTNWQVTSVSQIELSNGSEGNFWGHASCPTFVPGTDSDNDNVTDSFAYNMSYGWETYSSPPVCAFVDITYFDGEDEFGEFFENETWVGIGNSMDQPYNLTFYVNASSNGIYLVNLTHDGVCIGWPDPAPMMFDFGKGDFYLNCLMNKSMMSEGENIFTATAYVNNTPATDESNFTVWADFTRPDVHFAWRTVIDHWNPGENETIPEPHDILDNPDFFFSPDDNTVHVLVNVTDDILVGLVQAQMMGMDGNPMTNLPNSDCDEIFNLTHLGGDLFYGNCTLGEFDELDLIPDDPQSPVQSGSLMIFAIDAFGNENNMYNNSDDSCADSADCICDVDWSMLGTYPYNETCNPAFSAVLIHDLGVFEMEGEPCLQFGPATTDLNQVTDFTDVNLVLEIQANLSCMNGGFWGPETFTTFILLEFASLDFEDESIAFRLMGLPAALDMELPIPYSFGDGYIYVNTTFFGELDTNTSISMFHLPFTETPVIIPDGGAAGFDSGSVTYVVGYDDLYFDPVNFPVNITGNLTFDVYGFSGYTLTDNVSPTLSFEFPTNNSIYSENVTQVWFELNGTGTPISNIMPYLDGELLAIINETDCYGVDGQPEITICNFTDVNLGDGNHNLYVIAWDYGGDYPGKNVTGNISFLVDTSVPYTQAYYIPGWQTADFNVTLNATDQGVTGIDYTNYSVDGGAWQKSTENPTILPITTDGNHSLDFYSVNNAGKAETQKTIYAALDKSAPVNLDLESDEPDYSVGDTIEIYSEWNDTTLHLGINCSLYINGTLNKKISSTDGICDFNYTTSTGDYPSINISVVAADAFGHTESQYLERDVKICGMSVTSDFTLPGDIACDGDGLIVDADDIIIDCDGYSITGNAYAQGISIMGNSGITVENCEITNFATGIQVVHSSGNTLQDNYVHDNVGDVTGISFYNVSDSDLIGNNVSFNQRGIRLEASDGNRFNGNFVYNNTASGLYLYDSDNNEITGGEFADNNMMGSGSEAGIYVTYYSDSNTISGIYMHGNRNGAINVMYSDSNMIEHNNIDDNCGDIRQIYAEGVEVLTIRYNNITNGTGYGIQAYGCNELRILNNYIINNANDGIRIRGWGGSDHQISNNLITDNTGNAIFLEDEDNVTVSGNTILRSSSDGVHVLNSEGMTISGNTIEDANIGVYFQNVGFSDVMDNNITEFSSKGILLEGGSTSYNTIESNDITGTNPNTIGIQIMDEYTDVLDNTLDCGIMSNTYGIKIGPGSVGNYLSGNEVSGCYWGFYAGSAGEFDMVEDSYHDNWYGMYMQNLQGTDSSISDSAVYGNCHGATVDGSQLYISDTDFSDNHMNNPECATTGLHLISSHVELENGNLLDNGDYGLLDQISTGSVNWVLTDDVTCRNNDIIILEGYILPLGGSITQQNCTITVAGVVFNNSQQGVIEFPVDTTSGNDSVGNQSYGVEVDIHTGTPYAGDVQISFYNSNPTGSSGYSLAPFGKYVDVTPDNTSMNVTWWILKIWYTDEELAASGFTESSLRIEYFDNDTGAWHIFNPPEGGVNTTNNYVWANITHFSLFGIFGSKPSSSTGGSPMVMKGGSSPLVLKGAVSNTYDINEEFQTGEPVKQTVSSADRVTFMIDNDWHTVQVVKKLNGGVEVQIQSSSFRTVINEGETANFDFNGDDVYDLALTVDRVGWFNFDLTFQKISAKKDDSAGAKPAEPSVAPKEPSEPADKPADKPAEPEAEQQPPAVQEKAPAKKTNMLALWIVLALVLVGIVAAFVMHKKERHPMHHIHKEFEKLKK
ncbi:right-handed parallel beta-helix repeat-containing protein [Candidatus Woesearchaeota archaeon]|nr:right-handed parallel beta-helix repeat-containing protein [Candidatus Woesearchaeota archaeon]